MSSWVSWGRSATSASDMPPAKSPRMSPTEIRVPRTHGLPNRTFGSMPMRSRGLIGGFYGGAFEAPGLAAHRAAPPRAKHLRQSGSQHRGRGPTQAASCVRRRSVRQAGQIRRRARRPSRTTTFHPTDVQAVRARLGASQAEFALMIGASVATLRNWEQGRRTPDGPALALLRVAARNPKAVIQAAERGRLAYMIRGSYRARSRHTDQA